MSEYEAFEVEMYPKILAYVLRKETITVTEIQRHFKCGYIRAARVIDRMELEGFVGSYETNKPRTVFQRA